MGTIKASKLIFDYVERDEEENIEEVNRATDGMSSGIEKGTFVAIPGHNGSGKSTSAKQINGIPTPTERTAWAPGMNTSDDGQIWEIRKKAGMVLQSPDNQVIGNVVEKDVGFGSENTGISTDKIWRWVDESLEAVGMTAHRYKSPNKLSGRRKQRVAITGVMAMRPGCIILSEPMITLDPNGRKEVIKTVQALNRKEGITVFLITHHMEEVIHADRAIVMDDGEVVMDGAPREIFSKVKESKGYRMDVPQMAELVYELREGGLDIPEGILTRRELPDSLLPLFAERFPGQATLETGKKHVN